jgi:hypothetical protein
VSLPKKKRPGAKDKPQISDTWRAWAAENLVRGVPRAEVIDALMAEGAERSLAESTVRTLESSPVFAASRRLARGSRRTAQVTTLLSVLRRDAPSGTTLARVPYPGRERFDELYWSTNTPVVFTDIVSRWPAMERWTLAGIAARFGDATVDVTSGRERDPDYDMNHARHTQTTTLGAYVERIEALNGRPSNDFYMVANNRNLEKALGPLLDDVALPSDLIRTENAIGGAAFWLGPAGTVTPLHHDTSNILFCQVLGRKRYRMVAPTEIHLFDEARAMYAAVDPEAPDLSRFPWWPEVRVIDEVIAPGEALFIPVGWWHHVRALDVSISLAVNAFIAPNRFDWFVPGAV